MDQEQDSNKLIDERRDKLKALRAAGQAYPNDFRRKHMAAELHTTHGSKTKEELEGEKPPAVIAGRMVLKRVMGKESFATRQDGSARFQVYSPQNRPDSKDFSTGISVTS